MRGMREEEEGEEKKKKYVFYPRHQKYDKMYFHLKVPESQKTVMV